MIYFFLYSITTNFRKLEKWYIFWASEQTNCILLSKCLFFNSISTNFPIPPKCHIDPRKLQHLTKPINVVYIIYKNTYSITTNFQSLEKCYIGIQHPQNQKFKTSKESQKSKMHFFSFLISRLRHTKPKPHRLPSNHNHHQHTQFYNHCEINPTTYTKKQFTTIYSPKKFQSSF